MRALLLSASCLATTLAALPALAQVSDGKVKIGILNDQSGVYADFGGKWSVDAARMAVEDFGGKGQGAPVSFISVEPANIRLLGVKKAERGDGVIVRLQEMDGKRTKAAVNVSPILKITRAEKTDLLERNGKPVSVKKSKAGASIETMVPARGIVTILLK